jgi:lipopolysaccharide transport system permease protein
VSTVSRIGVAGEFRRIEATQGWVLPRLRDAWRRRELVFFFARRDIKLKYAQTMLGWLWTVVQPVGMMLVFTLAFRKLGKVETDSLPYPIFAFSALTFWLFFSRAISNGADSLVANSQILTKTACPRVLMPLSGVVSSLFDLLITFGLLLVFAALYGKFPSWHIALVPGIVLVGSLLVFGLALILSAVNVRHRDVRNLLPLALQLWLFLSPIAYPLHTLGKPWTTLFSLNPLTGFIDGFRWAVVGATAPSMLAVTSSCVATVVAMIVGLLYFARVERLFADVA